MAERRMFSKKIVESDAFLDMPIRAQLLYFHLCMNADDDGFVNATQRVRSMLGATNKDLDLLIKKGFLIRFDSGVVVIKHWCINNYIQKDRYQKTSYFEELSQLGFKKDKTYTLDESKMDTKCIQNGYTSDTQVSIGKVSKDIYNNNINNNIIKKRNSFADFPQRVYSDEDLTEMEKMKRRK